MSDVKPGTPQGPLGLPASYSKRDERKPANYGIPKDNSKRRRGY